MNTAQMFRERLSKPGIVVSAGIYDGVSARIVNSLGFETAYLTGYGVSATLLGQPDYGMITLTEIANHIHNLTKVMDIPLICDGDAGYGNALNVKRTIEEFEAAGAAAIQLEDQLYPKRCGHMENKRCIDLEENVKKIEMAADTRKDMLIIARTDARAPLGLDEAIKRAKAYKKAGADIIFVEAPQSVDELKRVADEVEGPLMANMVESGKTPLLTNKELENLGYKFVIYPVTGLYAAVKGMTDCYKQLLADDTSATFLDKVVQFPEFNKLIGLDEMKALEKKYAPRD